MDRLVTEYVVGADGVLHAARAGAWRLEGATGETDLHRRLAALPRTPAAITRAASTFGPLRLHADLVAVIPHAAWDEMGVVTAQSALPDWADVTDWMAGGCLDPMPTAFVQAMPLIRVLARLPEPVRGYATLLMDGAPRRRLATAAAEAQRELGHWDSASATAEIINAIDHVAAAGGPLALESGSKAAGLPTPCEDHALAWAIRLYLWVEDLLAGYGAPPLGLDISGILGSSISALPDLLRPLETVGDEDNILGRLIAQLRTESLDDWYAVADQMAHWVVAIDIRKRADAGRMEAGEVARLQELVPALLDGVTEGLDGATTAGELTALLVPRLERRVRRLLEQARASPYPADRPVGTYVRALWSVWMELTDARPPQRCAASVCQQTFPAHGNRLYCDRHRLTRDRDRKRIATLAPDRPLAAGEP
jgi:hypothetical protein